MAKRTDKDYQIEALSKGLVVWQALEGSLADPLPIEQIIFRTEFSRDFVYRCLRTLRLHGLAEQDNAGRWSLGKKSVVIANRFLKV